MGQSGSILRMEQVFGTYRQTKAAANRLVSMQTTLNFGSECGHGGWREGSGKKAGKGGVAHASREGIRKDDPIHVTMKRVHDMSGFRQAREARVIVEAIKGAQRDEFRIVHFSIQSDHLHFVIEADGSDELARGMKGLGCRVAKGLNKLWHRKGKVFAGRFHSHVLKTLAEVRNVLRYVLNNHRKHGFRGPATQPDVFSSGRYFDGWSDFPRQYDPRHPESYVAVPGYKIAVGWKRRYPLIPLASVPGR